MKKEAKVLLNKAKDSLILSVELFNRPWDRGRKDGVLILLNHAFEMLLKAGLVHRGGKIKAPGSSDTIGLKHCLRKATTDAKTKFLSNEQAIVVQIINALRDGAQHYFIDVSEQHLYMQVMAGVTLFTDLMQSVFGIDFRREMPIRALPISTIAPQDTLALFETEMEEVRHLLTTGRKRLEGTAKLRSLAAVDRAVRGEDPQLSAKGLGELQRDICSGRTWKDVFPGVASIVLTAQGYGPSLDLRITKKDGFPIALVPADTPGAPIVAVKRVNELDYYSLGHGDLADKVETTRPKTTAIIRVLRLDDDPECCKEIRVGRSVFKRYSAKALDRMKKALADRTAESFWSEYRKSRTQT